MMKQMLRTQRQDSPKKYQDRKRKALFKNRVLEFTWMALINCSWHGKNRWQGCATNERDRHSKTQGVCRGRVMERDRHSKMQGVRQGRVMERDRHSKTQGVRRGRVATLQVALFLCASMFGISIMNWHCCCNQREKFYQLLHSGFCLSVQSTQTVRLFSLQNHVTPC